MGTERIARPQGARARRGGVGGGVGVFGWRWGLWLIGKVRCVNATWQVGKVVGSHVFNSFSVEGENSGWLCLLTFKRLEYLKKILKGRIDWTLQ